jgi:hypothetical protein
MFLQPTKEQQESMAIATKMHNDKFMALTHQVFKADSKGREWLDLITESLILLQPVANPNEDEKWAYFKEGMCTFIRNIRQTVRLNEMTAKAEMAKPEVIE